MLIHALAVPRFGVTDREGGLCFTAAVGPNASAGASRTRRSLSERVSSSPGQTGRHLKMIEKVSVQAEQSRSMIFQ